MSWHRICDKPLSITIMSKFTGAYLCHSAREFNPSMPVPDIHTTLESLYIQMTSHLTVPCHQKSHCHDCCLRSCIRLMHLWGYQSLISNTFSLINISENVFEISDWQPWTPFSKIFSEIPRDLAVLGVLMTHPTWQPSSADTRWDRPVTGSPRLLGPTKGPT